MKHTQKYMEKQEQKQEEKQPLQEVCTHKYPDGSDAMPNTWHDGHCDYYVCKLCGKQVKV